MENAKKTKAQELSAQELEAVSGGAYKPDNGSYSMDGVYETVADAVSEKLSHSGLPYYGDKEKSTYTEEYSKKTYSTPE
ncbi:hypothetical protein [Leptolyngbya sp. NIES-2104]|uniref:hypothetical protein n=1 Tax=Leptolyngbya sp. NIES-2104 TaxID=1552121 RepID=UPI0006ECCA9F|nr:hypothetical protein [Leptolyngbya sp. NIES-2104]GAP94199.1 hypothetical protein NIES2104_07100 [Leptolyngbya sp. NIES-2104]